MKPGTDGRLADLARRWHKLNAGIAAAEQEKEGIVEELEALTGLDDRAEKGVQPVLVEGVAVLSRVFQPGNPRIDKDKLYATMVARAKVKPAMAVEVIAAATVRQPFSYLLVGKWGGQ